jgi:hypothetical protein
MQTTPPFDQKETIKHPEFAFLSFSVARRSLADLR